MDFWYLVTSIGEPQVWAASAAILLLSYFIFRKKLSSEKRKLFRKVLYIYIPGVLVSLLIVLLMKSLITIERPCIPCVIATNNCNQYCDIDNSFPSGHTTAMFAVVTSLYLALRRKQLLPLYIIALYVAASRYFLGVHWPADLIGGAVLGITIPAIFWIVYKKEYEPRDG